nr:MAG TPA: Protein of unknown function (DUF4065) [Caudoviricetes sp.]
MILSKPSFNEAKATGLAAYLLEMAGGTMNYMKLIKLMYLVDRVSLCEIGQFVTNDDMFSLHNGPLLSNVDDLITEPSRQKTVWGKHITAPSNYEVSLTSANHKTVQSMLSDYEVEVAQRIFQQYGKMDKWALVEHLHKVLPEWKDPGQGHRSPISLDDIFADCGKSSEERLTILRYLNEQAQAERFFQ